MRFRKGCFEVVISRHAFERAMQRGIHLDLIESCLQTGRVERFGKSNFKMVKDFRKFSVICVDEMVGSAIKIVTIEKKWKL